MTFVECAIIRAPSLDEYLDALKYADHPRRWFAVEFTVSHNGKEHTIRGKPLGITRAKKRRGFKIDVLVLHCRRPHSVATKGTYIPEQPGGTLFVPSIML